MSGKKNIYFVHIPRNAGEFIKKNYGYAFYTSDDFGLDKHAKFKDSPVSVVPFTIVRNPYERLESLYYSEKNKKHDMSDEFFPEFETYIKKRLFEKETLSDRIGKGNQNKVVAKRTILEGLVLEPQSRYTGDIPRENILYISDIKKELSLFLNKNDIEIGDDWSKVNATKSRSHGGWTSQMQSIVRDYFRNDFEAYGFDNVI
jgi:hypothetical protein